MNTVDYQNPRLVTEYDLGYMPAKRHCIARLFDIQIRYHLILLLLIFIPRPAQALRLVSLKPNITLTLQALGVGDEIVGITKYCPKPNAAAIVIADYVSVQSEAIVRLNPDFIFSSRENSQSRQYEALTRAGLKIMYFDFATLTDLMQSITGLGELLGRQDATKTVVADLQTRLDKLQSTSTKNWRDKNFAVIVQRKPLMIAAGKTFISSLFERVGLKNAFGTDQIPYPVLEEEAFVRKPIDVVFDMDHGGDWGKNFYGRSVVPIRIEDYLAAPQSVRALEKLIAELK